MPTAADKRKIKGRLNGRPSLRDVFEPLNQHRFFLLVLLNKVRCDLLDLR